MLNKKTYLINNLFKLKYIITLFFLFCITLSGKEYSFPSAGLRIEVSSKWDQIPKEEVQKISPSRELSYLAAFDLIDNQYYFDYPYFFIQDLPDSTMNFRSFPAIANDILDTYGKVLNNDLIKGDSRLQVLDNLNSSNYFIDEENKYIILKIRQQTEEIDLITVSCLFPYKNGIVQIAFYMLKNQFFQYADEIDIIYNSLIFDKEFQYNPNINIEVANPYALTPIKKTFRLITIASILIFISIVFVKNQKNKKHNIMVTLTWEDWIEHNADQTSFTEKNQNSNEDDFLNYDGIDELYMTDAEKDKKFGDILDLKGKITKSEIRHKYYEQIEKYHPDKVSHLGTEIQQFAEKKTKDLNNAYSYFKKKYNL